MKKIFLNEDICLGCGCCVGTDSNHFEFADGRVPVVTNNENLESDALNDAICACPVEAISIIECSEEAMNEEKECACCHSECACGCENSCNSECNCDSECDCGCN